MKVLEKNLSLREKILLLILAIIIIGFTYYFLVDQPVKNQIAAAHSHIADLESELSIEQAKLSSYNRMYDELESVKNGGIYTAMPSYNASHEERAYLDSVLSTTNSYNINFSDVTRNGEQIRRDFTVSYSVTSYEEAMDVLTRLHNAPQRCLIGDVSCSVVNQNVENAVSHYLVNCVATFYETLVGGTPDAGLPADESASDMAATATAEAVDSLF